MNPKDMTDDGIAEYPKDFTNQDLLSAMVEDIQQQPFSSRCKSECDELLRRLDEADALRKENELLLKLLGECPKRNRLGAYSSSRLVQVDIGWLICEAKEGEASHE